MRGNTGSVGRGFGRGARPPSPAHRIRATNRRLRPSDSLSPAARRRAPGDIVGGGTGTERAGRRCGEHRVRRSRIRSRRSPTEWCAPGPAGEPVSPPARDAPPAARRRRPRGPRAESPARNEPGADAGEHRVRRSRIRSRRSTAESCAPDPGDEPASPSIRQPLAGSPPPRPRGHRGGGAGTERAGRRGGDDAGNTGFVGRGFRRGAPPPSGARRVRPVNRRPRPPETLLRQLAAALPGTSRGVAGTERAGR